MSMFLSFWLSKNRRFSFRLHLLVRSRNQVTECNWVRRIAFFQCYSINDTIISYETGRCTSVCVRYQCNRTRRPKWVIICGKNDKNTIRFRVRSLQYYTYPTKFLYTYIYTDVLFIYFLFSCSRESYTTSRYREKSSA